ncbi:MAG: pyridoxal phosphate-dependent aminotransferase [Candidatus Altiarchaeota archaeon]|nr:pyridoxal phosphate-dependent aminotransferase [Candidatus Altiarchaeota archaeon]
MEFATRLSKINESATFKYSALAKKEGMIDLTIGRTSFDTPKAIKDAAKRALDEGRVNYTPTKGIPELREKIVEKLRDTNNITGLEKENILVSAGAKQVIFEAAFALINEGDEVAIPDPSWVSYESIIKLAGGRVTWLALHPEEGFIPGERFFTALENSHPKLIFINSPNNPTGAVYPKKTIEKIVDIAERKNAWILSDEIYEKLLYEGEHYSAGSVCDKCITVNGYSKEFSMTGWRLGYAASKIREVIDKMDMIQGQSVSCATSFVQYAGLEAYTREARRETEAIREELRKRRDHLMERLDEMDLLCRKPGGAFYVFPSFGGLDDVKLANRFLEAGVATIPGSPFGPSGKGCLRMSYGASDMGRIDEAVDRMKKAI